jgi:predicted 3-demethylubiquinone-9 3-methyltransferase (glyoxalase superfamily)
MQKITPFLWFDTQAEEAAKFYTTVFKDSRIVNVSYFSEAGPRPPGMVLTVSFELFGQEYVALNGGPEFNFSPAVSFLVDCESQAEVDFYWEQLSAGGVEEQCGWLRDKYGVSWQIVPSVLFELMNDPDPEKAQRVTHAMLQMVKLDIAGLKRAHAGE